MLQISLLGPLEVRRDGELTPVPGGKTAELLVRLALDAGLLVRTERLLDDLWEADAITTRRNTLQSKIAKLRRALGDPSLIDSGDGGYRLDVEPFEVDALAVLRETGAAARLLGEGDDRGAADLATAALERYRGNLLQAAAGDWAEPHRARLEEARTTLLETKLSARLRLGDGGEVIGELEAALAEHPFQESLWELLITALYRAGRQAEALATYQRVRTLLADELGLDPGPQLQELEQQILAHAGSLRPVPRAPGAIDAPTGNLPSMTADLVGREIELTELSELLARARLVEIVGPGGVGKTAVAIAAARRSASGPVAGEVWLARLETTTTADEVVDTLIAAMGVTGGEPAMMERLGGGAALVILDNCEHVLDVAAALVLRLLDASSELRILCTSQVPLDIDGEAVFELMPLSITEAAELFARRAGANRRARGISGTDDTVLELCRSLDGLPLAIELAAARTKTLSVDEIIRRLDDRFRVLSDPTSRKPERRRSLRSTIGWSYDLLFPDDQRGLWALATFAGGAPLPAVEAVVEALDVPLSAAIDVVGRLAGRSLVIVDDEDASSGRYRLLDSIRAFALAAMTDAGMSERALAAHAAWFADVARSSTRGVRSGRQAEYLAFARTERANIDAALAWSARHDPLRALAIVDGFGWAWVVLGDSRGAQRILAALDAAGGTAPARDRADALLLASWIEASTDRLELAREHIAAATGLAEMIDDVDLQARCCYYLAYVESHRGRFREAMELTDRCDVLYDGLDRPWDRAANWLFAARAAISAGDEARSVDASEQVQRWLRTVDDPWLHVRRDAMLGELARLQRRFDDAVIHIGRAAETSKRLGFLQTEAYQTASLGRAQSQTGDYETGAATLGSAIEKAEAIGDMRLAALGRVHLGRLLRALGQTRRARTALEAAAVWHRSAGGGEQAALGDCLLAAMDATDGVPDAGERLAAILDEAQRRQDAPVEVFALDALALSAADAGDLARARELSESADMRMKAAAHFITDLDRTDAHIVRERR